MLLDVYLRQKSVRTPGPFFVNVMTFFNAQLKKNMKEKQVISIILHNEQRQQVKYID